MGSIRMRATSEADGELCLRGLPIRKGQQAEVIVLTDAEGGAAEQVLPAVLASDPSWDWLSDPAEDLYTEADVR